MPEYSERNSIRMKKALTISKYKCINMVVLIVVIVAIVLSYILFSEYQTNRIKKDYGSQTVTVYNVDYNNIQNYSGNDIIEDINVIDIYTTYQENNKKLYIGAMDSYNLSNINIIDGRLPEKENEIAIRQSALIYINSNKKIGDFITLNNNGFNDSYYIVGLLDDFLKSNVIYSFDNSLLTQNSLDAIICDNENIEPIITNVLIKFDNNVDMDQISSFLDENSLANFQYNNYLYEDNHLINFSSNIKILLIISIIIIFISFLYTSLYFNTSDNKLKFLIYLKNKINKKSFVIKIFSILFLINLMIFFGSSIINTIAQENEITIQGDFVIEKTVNFSTGALAQPINLYDGITDLQYKEIKSNNEIKDTRSIKNIDFNLIENDKDLQDIYPKADSNSSTKAIYEEELSKYNYNTSDNIYFSNISFLDQDMLRLIEEYNNIEFNYNKLNSGNEIILLVAEDQNTFTIDDILDFTQVIHQYNSNNYFRIDFNSRIGYILYIPEDLYDLFNKDINIVMSSDYLEELGLSLPYTTISINLKATNDNNSTLGLLKSYIKYKGNSTINFKSRSDQIAGFNNSIVTALIIIIATIIYLMYDLIIILIYQTRVSFVDKPNSIIEFLTKNVLQEVVIIEIISIIISLPICLLLKILIFY